MTWGDVGPNLLIGLRDGLEAGLLVSLLLAVLRRAGVAAGAARGWRESATAVWLGVLAAVTVAGSVAAVATYSSDVLSAAAQAAIGGVLSLIAVGLVTSMVFWMRPAAEALSTQPREELTRATAVGAGALTVTALFAVGRQGLETTLFVWTTVKASGSTAAPLVGAVVGLILAVTLCWLVYRQASRLDAERALGWTGLAFAGTAAGLLAFGVGDLQNAGWLPGSRWVAFDVSAHVNAGSWVVSVVSGVTQLTPRMTVPQVAVWVGYLLIVTPLLLRTRSAVSAAAVRTRRTSGWDQSRVGPWERLTARRSWSVAGTLVVVPALTAGLLIAALPTANAAATMTVTVTSSQCAPEWTAGQTGTQIFDVSDVSSRAGEVELSDASGAVYGRVETIGPGTTVPMIVTLGAGHQYQFVCRMFGATFSGALVRVTGPQQSTPLAVKPILLSDLSGPNAQYEAYAATMLAICSNDARALRSALAAGDLAGARRAWLTAQLDWERVGASYDSFGDAGLAVDGLPGGLPGGVSDPGFTGLHRVEYGLYHGESLAELVPIATQLITDLGTVRSQLDTDNEAGDPTNLVLRGHEVLEDALRDHLSGIDNEGSGMAYAETYADTQVTVRVLGELAPLLTGRAPNLVATATAQFATLQAALLATQSGGSWQPVSAVPQAARERVDAAIGAMLETLSVEPNLLEVRPAH